MTEKRFTLKYIGEQHISANLYDDKTFIGSIGLGAELIVELLNTLSDENEQLKKEIGKLHEQIFSHSIGFKSLYNDYRTLKLQDDDMKLYQRKLEKENEQLKQENKMMKGVIYDMDDEVYCELFGEDD